MFSQTLCETLPTYLLRKLSSFYEKERLRRRLHPTSPEMLVGERRVYDLVNCGPRQSFVVGPINPIMVHNCGYGAGPGKIRLGLSQQGVEMSMAEAKRLHQAYWALFAQVKAFGRWLEAQWENNGGWWLNGIGRPLCVAADYKRDIINRDIQSTGHDCFMLFCKVTAEELQRAGIRYVPYVWDLHDCCSVEVPDEQVAEAKRIIDDVVPARVAEILGGTVRLKWDANPVSKWSEDKTEAMSLTQEGVHLIFAEEEASNDY